MGLCRSKGLSTFWRGLLNGSERFRVDYQPNQSNLNPMTPASIREIIHAACPNPRIDWLSKTRCVIYEGYLGSSSDSICCALADTGHVDSGKEGWEYLRGLGQVQFVRALRMGSVNVRVLSTPIYPQGQFSNLAALERKIKP